MQVRKPGLPKKHRDLPALPSFKYGDRVRILHSGNQRGRIVELRGPLAPGGVQVYRVRIHGRLKPTYAEVREDQLTVLPAENSKKKRTAAG